MMKQQLIFMIFNFILIGINAQTAVVSSGLTVSSSGGSTSYSIGQILYKNNSTSNYILQEGVQQTYEIMPVGLTPIEVENKIAVFPNPFADVIIIKLNDYKLNNDSSYSLFDANGKLINDGEIKQQLTAIPLIDILPGIYFVKVQLSKNEVITKKIIKN